jgi:hypothetical protein
MSITLDNEAPIYKVGITTYNVIDKRLSEIAIGLFKHLRYIPRISVKRFRNIVQYREMEKAFHNQFKDCKANVQKDDKICKFNGYSECFALDEDTAVKAFDELLEEYDG